MTECSTVVTSVLASERDRWTCRQIAPDRLLLVTSRQFADGDTVELMVQTVGDEVIVSDGGEVLARLDSVGVSPDSGRVARSWSQLLAAHELEFDRGQLTRRTSVENVAQLIQEMADAVANVDAVRLLAPSPRRLPFADRVLTYLEAEFPMVEPRPKLLGSSGISHQLTAAAGTEKRMVYIQTASGQNNAAQRVSMEHCFTLFSDINGNLPVDRKLVVLDDDAPEWRPESAKLLSSVAYVGAWSARERWTQFIWGPPPSSRLLLSGEQQALDS